jgi:hypothetical protein
MRNAGLATAAGADETSNAEERDGAGGGDERICVELEVI